MKKLITPFENLSGKTKTIIALGWVGFLLVLWFVTSSIGTTHLFPTPSQVGRGFSQLFAEGLVTHLLSSLSLFLMAVFFSIAASLTLAYSSPIPLLTPLSAFASKMRYLPLVGLSFYIAILISDARAIQISMLVVFMSTFLITSLLGMISDVPEQELDHARTLGCTRWEVLLEVVIKGRLDYVFEVVRQNLAVVWMTLVTVESILPSEGGLGFLIQNSGKLGNHGRIIALYIIILGVGLLIDGGLKRLRKLIFRYSKI